MKPKTAIHWAWLTDNLVQNWGREAGHVLMAYGLAELHWRYGSIWVGLGVAAFVALLLLSDAVGHAWYWAIPTAAIAGAAVWVAPIGPEWQSGLVGALAYMPMKEVADAHKGGRFTWDNLSDAMTYLAAVPVRVASNILAPVLLAAVALVYLAAKLPRARRTAWAGAYAGVREPR